MSTSPSPSDVSSNASPERINQLAGQIAQKMSRSLEEIDTINLQVKLLSFNAQIEAARAGMAGRTFSVVGAEMGNLASKTAFVAQQLSSDTRHDILELETISQRLASDVRGTRLSDLALTNIDLIDRNLYERSCDVRWWATDASVVDALSHATPEACAFASQRLGVILKAYTVYFDIVVCDTSGQVIANGKPEEFQSQGQSMAHAEWFQSAMSSRTGDDFGFQSVHASPLVNQHLALVYSCGVRESGQSMGRLIGAIGIIFRWESLAQTIVENTPLSPDEKARTRVCIVDSNGILLADTGKAHLQRLPGFQDLKQLLDIKKGFLSVKVDGTPTIGAHAFSPGYETYATRWHSLILQRVARNG